MAERKFTKEHEWVVVEGGVATVGITEYAQEQLGDVVYVELPDVGTTLTAGQVFGTIESVKAVSELFAPMSGQVVAVNDALKTAPERINADPHGTWLITIAVSNPSEAGALLDASQYSDLVK